MFGRKYPNSGQLRTMLSDIDKRIEKRLKTRKKKVKAEPVNLNSENVLETLPSYIEIEIPGKIKENIAPMCAICAQIAVENVNHAHYALRVASRLIEAIDDFKQRGDVVAKVSTKLRGLHNNSYYQLWLQNMTYKRDKETGTSPYDARLCRVVMGEDLQLWNNSWLKQEYSDGFPQQSVVNPETLAKVTPIITFREARTYYDIY